jgi:hypothetical protein
MNRDDTTKVVNDWRLDSEPVRLHLDWWGQCRTCRYWQTEEREGRGSFDGECKSLSSPLRGQTTSTEGECPAWDSYDEDAALEVLYRES